MDPVQGPLWCASQTVMCVHVTTADPSYLHSLSMTSMTRRGLGIPQLLGLHVVLVHHVACAQPPTTNPGG